MKIFIAFLFLVLAVAAEPSYLPTATVVAHQVPVSTSVWPPYGVYGKAAVLNKYAYPAAAAGVYGSWGWPATYGNRLAYSAPILATGTTAKIVDNGLWNYAGYGHGYGLGLNNNYWL
ncbi:uncharacterized protein LOC129744363 [Uranotaenia lowii]|uniref:uncharacterized protein LOC129744363 n=1 Tax=Uranotaenia lowii TaxID=190385 RepID=UPI00247A18B5|nr:uncharacterized protein LOC129744363 [Uranotaenia lowii]